MANGVSNRSRPLASRGSDPNGISESFGRVVSNRSRPLASRRINLAEGQAKAQEVPNRSRPLASRGFAKTSASVKVTGEFPIDRVP